MSNDLSPFHALSEDAAATPAAEPAEPAGPHKRDLIAGLEKGLAVIEAFDQDRPRLTISEVATRCKLTRAAARRYLITLEYLGYVSSDRKMYSLSPKVLRLGQSYMHSARLPRIVEPELHKLAFSLKEASSAGVLDGDDVICIAATSAGRMVSLTLQPGTRVPAYCTANGRMLLSALPQQEVDGWIARQTLAPLTPHTVTDPAVLRDEIVRARLQGWCTADQEMEVGLRTLSVPLKNYRGDVLAALNISVHASRMSLAQLIETCLPPLLHTQTTLRSTL
jgi:IclR family pca regulon transcriptional regulator